MDKVYDVIVIGGGAAGLMAAGQAAQMGAKTLLLEKMERPGRKLFISGKHSSVDSGSQWMDLCRSWL